MSFNCFQFLCFKNENVNGWNNTQQILGQLILLWFDPFVAMGCLNCERGELMHPCFDHLYLIFLHFRDLFAVSVMLWQWQDTGYVTDIVSPGWAWLQQPLGCISNASHTILGSQVACWVFWTGSGTISTLSRSCLSARMYSLSIQSVYWVWVIAILTAMLHMYNVARSVVTSLLPFIVDYIASPSSVT